jgi:hypothetical protein
MYAIFKKIIKNEFWVFAIWILGMSAYGVYVVITNGS